MPEAGVVQNAFNAGEIGPTLAGRGDVAAYGSGLAKCENWTVLRAGGMEKRAGTRYIGVLPDETNSARLHPFVFSATTTFLLSFSENAIYVWKDDTPVLHPTTIVNASDAVNATTNEITLPLHGFVEGLQVVVTDVVGSGSPGGVTVSAGIINTPYYVRRPQTLTAVQADKINTSNDTIDIGTAGHIRPEMGPYRATTTRALPGGISSGQDYYIKSNTGGLITLSEAIGGITTNITTKENGILSLTPTGDYERNTFQLSLVSDGTYADIGASADLGTAEGWALQATMAAGSPALVSPQLKVTTSYADAELDEIQFAQDKDILYICHKNHPVRKLTRYADACWELSDVEFNNGPYMGIQRLTPNALRADVTMTLGSAAEGFTTVTASEPVFAFNDVKRTIRFGDTGNVNNWGWARIISVDDPQWITADLNDDGVTFEDGGTVGTATDHPFVNGEGPARFAEADADWSNSTFYIHVRNANSISVHTTQADALDDESPVAPLNGSGPLEGKLCSAWIREENHGFTNNEAVTLTTSGTLPPHLNTTNTFFIRDVSPGYFALASVDSALVTDIVAPNSGGSGGATGTGTHTIRGLNVTATNNARIEILSQCPDSAPSTEWQLSAFGDDSTIGYPGAVTFHEQRLVLGGNPGAPQTIYGSQIGAYEDFGPDEQSVVFRTDPAGDLEPSDTFERLVTDASAYQFTLQSEDLNAIHWLRSTRVLLAGTSGGVFAVMASSLGEAITPTSVNARRATQTGAAQLTPVTLGTQLVFVEASGSVMARTEWQPQTQTLQTQDLFALAPHLGEGYQLKPGGSTQNPIPAILATRSDGTLLHLTFDPQEEVAAWSRYVIGGIDTYVESSTVLPDADGGATYMVVKRGMESSEAPRIDWEAATISSAYTSNTAYEGALVKNVTATAWDAGTDRIVTDTNTLSNNDKVQCSSSSGLPLPPGIDTETEYRVHVWSVTSISLHTNTADGTSGLNPVDITETATEPHFTIDFAAQFLTSSYGRMRGDQPTRGDVVAISKDEVQIDGERWVYVSNQTMKLYADTVITLEVKTSAIARSQGIIVSDDPTFQKTYPYTEGSGLAAYPIADFTYFKLFGGMPEPKAVKDYSFVPRVNEWETVSIPIGQHLSTITTPGEAVTGEGFYFGLYIDNDYETTVELGAIGVDVPAVTRYRNVRFSRPRRFVERLSPRFSGISEIEDAEFLDCSASAVSPVDSGSTAAGTDPATTFGGFIHLANQTVSTLVDGGWSEDVVVGGDGRITIENAGSKLVAGFPYKATAQILPPEAETGRQQVSTSMVWATSIQAMVRINRSLGLRVGYDPEKMIPHTVRTLMSYRNFPPPLFTGIFETRLDVPAGRSNGWYIISEGPHPTQVLAAMTRVEFSDR